VIPTTSQSCVGGCGNLENVAHLFLHYDFFGQIKTVVSDWLGFVMVTLFRISDHLALFSSFRGFSNANATLFF